MSGAVKETPRRPDRDRRGISYELMLSMRGMFLDAVLLVDDSEDVAGREDEVLLTGVLDLGAAVLAVDDDVSDGDVEGDAVAAIVDATRANCQDFALLGLLLGGVGDDQAGGRGLLGFERTDENAVFERLDADRHVLTSPFTG